MATSTQTQLFLPVPTDQGIPFGHHDYKLVCVHGRWPNLRVNDVEDVVVSI